MVQRPRIILMSRSKELNFWHSSSRSYSSVKCFCPVFSWRFTRSRKYLVLLVRFIFSHSEFHYLSLLKLRRNWYLRMFSQKIKYYIKFINYLCFVQVFIDLFLFSLMFPVFFLLYVHMSVYLTITYSLLLLALFADHTKQTFL